VTKELQDGPLSGLKVVELGSFIAGPFCGQLLADLGAQVIKVEPPGTGDTMRQWGQQKSANGLSLWWPIIGRNKLSVTIDLRVPEGQALARDMIRQADVLVENFRPGTLEAWNLSPESLRLDNPGLVIARVSGYGQTGPYNMKAGFAAAAEAAAGLRHLTGYPDRVPTRVGISIGDSLAGLHAALGVLAALVARPARAGRGQIVDAAITESVLSVMESVISECAATGAIRGRTGPILPKIAPSSLYPTQDGAYAIIAANGDGLFRRLAAAMGRPELAEDPRYATHIARGERQEELDELIAAWTAAKPLAEIVELMDRHGVPAGPVNDAAAVLRDPQFRERAALIDTATAEGVPVTMQGPAPKFSDTPTRVRWTGPKLGQHTDDVLLNQLNLGPDRVAALRQAGVI
jgi:formyl-CoA transferase/succinyl-CoA--D-citramalate CoA-transferase